MRPVCLALTAVLVILLESCGTLSKPSPPSVNKKQISTDARVADCDGSALSLPPELRRMLKPRTGEMIPDDHWADLAERIPGGFAGILYDLNMKPIMMLTHPEQATAVKAAIASDRAFRHFDVMGARVLKARWDFAQLVDWYNYLAEHTSLWEASGIVSGDKNEETNRIYFGVETEPGRQRLIEKLNALHIPCDLVRIGLEGRAYPDSAKSPSNVSPAVPAGERDR